MARLIDADALMELYEMGDELKNYEKVLSVPLPVIQQNIKDMPTIEAEPVKHGRWEIIVDDYDCEMMKCSCCGSEFYDGDNDTVDCMLNYCPNCGAKMEEEQ